MAKRKTAVLKIEGFSLACPHCGEAIYRGSNGSSMFSVHDPLPDEVECDACGETSPVPAAAKKLLA